MTPYGFGLSVRFELLGQQINGNDRLRGDARFIGRVETVEKLPDCV